MKTDLDQIQILLDSMIGRCKECLRPTLYSIRPTHLFTPCRIQGPMRSELMIITGIIFSRMRRKRFKDEEVFPVSC